MYIQVSNPNTQRVSVRVYENEDEFRTVSAEFNDEGRARVTQEDGEILMERIDGITEYTDNTDEQEDED